MKKVCICLYYIVLCFIKQRTVDMLEKQSRKEKNPDLKVYGHTSISGEREKHWNYILEYNIKDKENVCELRWEVYKKYKQGLIKRDILVQVPHMKGARFCVFCG